MTERIKVLIDNLKHAPGVYLMHDKDDKVIYVGKAKDLQKRVSQYFLRPQVGKVMKMAQNVEYFETIIVQNEKEAFVLEMNLIHKYMPRYNILLKDGSHYPYIAIKKHGDVTVSIKRSNKDNKYTYFGPFPRSTEAYQMVDLLHKLFPIRKCNNIPHETCLYYHLGQCLAPCINIIDDEEYETMRKQIISFLKGNNMDKQVELRKKIKEASESLDFERAKEYKELLDSINHINDSQSVEAKEKADRDIFAYSSRDGYIAIAYLIYRNGLLLGKKSHVVEAFGEEEEQVGELITQLYENLPAPDEIVINSSKIIEEIKDFVDSNRVEVTKGKMYDLVLSAKQNADNALDEYFLSSKLDTNKLELIEELGNILNINTPYHIELFDNSHLQGSSPVGAMVAFVNGESAKSLYRKFNLNSFETRDDVHNMQEVITRHYLRSKNENKKMPDLILVDGGITQIHAAIAALQAIEVDIPVYGLYKNDKHQTNGIIDKDENMYNIDNKKLFFLLTRMQDEVHRFAISFHKEKRGKAMTTSILDNIKGLGDKRKEIILRLYPDISLLKNATLEELNQILPDDVALELYNRIH